MENKSKFNYVLMLLGLCLGTAAMIPEFSISIFDFSATVCKIGAIVLIVMSLVKQNNEWQNGKPTAFVALSITTAVLAFISIITTLFGVISWIGTIVGIISIVMARKAYNAEWNNAATAPIVTIACATVVAFYEVINDDAVLMNIAAIVAYVLILMNAPKTGIEALGKLKIAAILGIVTSVLYMIKIAGIVAWIPYLVFVVFVLLAFMNYKKAVPAANLLFIGSIVLVVEEVFDFIPGVDFFVCPVLALATITLSIVGWYKVITEMEKA